MFTQIAISLILAFLAHCGVSNPEVITYDANENSGFCVVIDEYDNQACIETKGVPGPFFCTFENCDVVNTDALQKPNSTLGKMLHYLGCSVDMQTSVVTCYNEGEKETIEGEEYTHKASPFIKEYNKRVVYLPALAK